MFDNERFDSIVRELSPQLFKYCLARTNYNKELAEETLNDVFAVLYTKWDTLDLDDNIRSYLYSVANNCIKHNLEKHRAYYNNVESYDLLAEVNGLGEQSHEDEYFSDEAQVEKQIAQIISGLDENEKALFKYRYIDKLPLMEIAEKTGIPYSTLRYQLFKLERGVKKKISKYFENNFI